MIGIYTIRVDGEVVGVHKNVITTEGKRVIKRYLAGQVGNIAQVIAIGTGTTVESVNDTALQFEFDRAEITFRSPDFINNKTIFKATFDAFSQGMINEVGMFSVTDTSLSLSSKLLFVFDSSTESWVGGSFVSDSNRIGGDSLRISPAISATVTSTIADVSVDLSSYTNSDKISFAYFVTNAFTSSVKLRLKTDNSNYYEYTISTPTAGYKITSFFKSNFTSVGVPSWGNITSADVLVTSTAGGGAVVDLDGLRIDDGDITSPEHVLVSRKVLSVGIQKTNVSALEIEYSLDATV